MRLTTVNLSYRASCMSSKMDKNYAIVFARWTRCSCSQHQCIVDTLYCILGSLRSDPKLWCHRYISFTSHRKVVVSKPALNQLEEIPNGATAVLRLRQIVHIMERGCCFTGRVKGVAHLSNNWFCKCVILHCFVSCAVLFLLCSCCEQCYTDL